MNDDPVNNPDHDRLAELLPDFALGALDEAESARVAAHLEGCAVCRDDLAGALEMLGLLAVVPAPDVAVRARVLARARAEAAASATAPPALAPASAMVPAERAPPVPSPVLTPAPVSIADRRRARSRLAGPVGWALATAAVVALAAMGVWNVALRQELDRPRLVAELLTDGDAHPLADSSLESLASGVVYVEPARSRALLMAHSLPPLTDDQRFQIWLFTPAGERLSGGTFVTVDNGHGQIVFEAPRPLADFAALGVSVEPAGGSAAPTTPLALGGWIR